MKTGPQAAASEVQGKLRGGDGRDLMLCLITLDGQSFALRTSSVLEVIGSAMIVKVPLSPAFMAGIVNHRGAMLTTVSLRSVLGLPPAQGKSCVVVMRAHAGGGECFGVLVDEMTGVLTLDGATVEKIPPKVAAGAQHMFRGMYVREQGAFVELDADHLRPQWLARSEGSVN